MRVAGRVRGADSPVLRRVSAGDAHDWKDEIVQKAFCTAGAR